MQLTKEQVEELKNEMEELSVQRDAYQQQAQDQLTAMGGAITYMRQLIQDNEQQGSEQQEGSVDTRESALE